MPTSETIPTVLELQDIHASYGRIQVLHGIDLKVAQGAVTSILGANGAGKTTTLRVLTGLLPGTGKVLFEGRSVLGKRPDEIVRLGISMVPESRELFTETTVEENLRLGAYARRDKAGIAADFDKVLVLFPRLGERLGQMAGTLSGGEQQMLTIGRALMARPKLLILDEPSLGLAPKLVDSIFRVIREIRDTGLSILLVEQNARMALSISDVAYLMETGEVILSGPAKELSENPQVQEAYI